MAGSTVHMHAATWGTARPTDSSTSATKAVTSSPACEDLDVASHPVHGQASGHVAVSDGRARRAIHTSGGGFSAPAEGSPRRYGCSRPEARASTGRHGPPHPPPIPLLDGATRYRPVRPIAPETWVIQDTAGGDQPGPAVRMNSMLIRRPAVVVGTGVLTTPTASSRTCSVSSTRRTSAGCSSATTTSTTTAASAADAALPGATLVTSWFCASGSAELDVAPTRWRWLGDDAARRWMSATAP